MGKGEEPKPRQPEIIITPGHLREIGYHSLRAAVLLASDLTGAPVDPEIMQQFEQRPEEQ